MDLIKVGEKLLSSVKSFNILPSTSDRPEVPARVAAAAAVARAIAGLPPHQRLALSSSSSGLASLYGSGPRGQTVERLEEEFYEKDFDPVRHSLENIPIEENDLIYFEKKVSQRLVQLDVVTEQLSHKVMEHHEELVKGMQVVTEVEQDLQVANVICKNGRRHLSSSMTEVSRDLVVTSNAKRKQFFLDMLPVLTQLQRALDMRASLDSHVEEGNYSEAFQILAEYLQLLDHFSELSAVQEMNRGIEAWLARALEKLDTLLFGVCQKFNPESYIMVADAYALIDDVSGFADKLQNVFTQIVLMETQTVLKDFVFQGLDSRAIEKKSRLTYNDLCFQLPETKFRNCLLKTLEVLFEMMCSYHSMMTWKFPERETGGECLQTPVTTKKKESMVMVEGSPRHILAERHRCNGSFGNLPGAFRSHHSRNSSAPVLGHFDTCTSSDTDSKMPDEAQEVSFDRRLLIEEKHKSRNPSFNCAGVNMSYPFGIMDNGCGLLEFQVDCNGRPKLHVHRNDYRILNTSMIPERRMTIVNEKLFERCELDPDVYDDLRNSSFLVSGKNSNITELRECGGKKPKHLVKLDCNRTSEYSGWYLGFDEAQRGSCSNVYIVPVLQKPKTLPKNSSQFLQLLQRGFLVEWLDHRTRFSDCASCESTKGVCGYSPYTEIFCCYCPDQLTHPHNCSDGSSVLITSQGADSRYRHKTKKFLTGAAIGGIIGVLGLIAVTVLLLLFYVRRNPRRGLSNHGFCKDRGHNIEAGRKIGILPIFSYNELDEATNSFAEENQLGNGGFGTVYLGYLKDGRSVAVKRLYQDNSRRVEQFLNEIEILSSLHHQNLVRLFGCTCPNSRELLLVYEYVPNGTLADHLHGERKRRGGISWGIRLSIAIETAQALAFLHCFDPPIFHRDVKSANILLDENFKAKVSDFGLSKLAPVNVSHVTTAPHGTPGYVDPEYHQSFQLTDKSDVYSFGVVLVEIISAKLAVDVSRNRKDISLANMAIAKIQTGALHELVDPDLEIEKNHEVKGMVSAVAELAYECLAVERDDRPDMKQVVYRLEQIRNLGFVEYEDIPII